MIAVMQAATVFAEWCCVTASLHSRQAFVIHESTPQHHYVAVAQPTTAITINTSPAILIITPVS